MGLSKIIKQHGFRSVGELAIVVSVDKRNLYNWYDKKPEFFEIILLGAEAKQRQNLEN